MNHWQRILDHTPRRSLTLSMAELEAAKPVGTAELGKLTEATRDRIPERQRPEWGDVDPAGDADVDVDDVDADTRTILLMYSSAGVSFVCRTQTDMPAGAGNETFQIIINAAHPRWLAGFGDLLESALPRITSYLRRHLADEFGERDVREFWTASYRAWIPCTSPDRDLRHYASKEFPV